ncbi:MAG: transposase, partial [Lentisphaeria bacterium]|nr:transposase [Lentisphaeria bacterium]
MTKVANTSIGELIDSTLNLAFDYVRSTRSCPGLEDRKLVRLGVCRALSNHESGRDWLQFVHESSDDDTARSTLSDAMRSPRRLQMLQEAQAGLFTVAGRQMAAAGIDWLEEFSELNGMEVLAADGHLIEHASHAAKDAKGRNVPVGNVYALDLRTGLSRAVTHVCGNGHRRHELPSFRRKLQISDQHVPTIWVLDRAYHDKGFWSRMKRDKGVVMITRMKENMRPTRFGQLPFDPNDPVNSGVTAHYLIGLEGAYGMMFQVDYCDPETGESFSFLTTT